MKLFSSKKNLLIISSHPAYYRTPVYQKLNSLDYINLTVVYSTKLGIGLTYDKQFKKKVDMNLPLLRGYNYKFLKNYSFKPGNSFFGQMNLSIIKEIISLDYDYVMIQGWNSFNNWIVSFLCYFLNIPVLVRGESPLNQEVRKPKWKIWIKKILLGKILFPMISSFLYIGEQNKKFYKYYGVSEKKLFFTPYAVDNKRFQKSSKKLDTKKDELRQDLNIELNDLAILFVGKLITKKRPIDLLQAYEKLSKRKLKTSNKKIHLIYVGSGKLEDKMKKYTERKNIKNVHFEGFQNQKELPRYYKVSDIFVLPSGMGETWGLVVNEAMNFKLPVIVSNIVGSGFDLVLDGKNGFHFPTGNIERLYEKIRFLVDNKKLRNRFGEKSLNIITNYSYEKDIDGIIKAIKSL